ncbi:MAG: tetratricopeptide repeat protein [Prolixibacteraceae bacterium]|nr:tetratricopeptide repeat protein [Prolixibacteraceae bacterium]
MNKIFLLLIAMFLLSACATTRNSTNKNETSDRKAPTAPVLSDEKRVEFEYLLIEGLKHKMNGNHQAAVQYFNGCLELDPNSAATMFELANVHVMKGELISAKLLLEKAIQINPDNKWYQLLLAQILQNNKQYVQASEIYQQLIKKDPENLEYYYLNAMLLTSAQEYDEAIKVYNQLERKTGFNEQIVLARQNLYRLSGKNKEAYAEVQKLIDNNPDIPEYYGIMADMYKEDRNMPKALEYYNKVLEADPGNGFVHFSLATFYFQEKNLEQGFFHAQKGYANPDVEIETKIQLYLMLASVPDEEKLSPEQMETLIQEIIQAHPADSRSYSIQADYYLQQNKQKEAAEYLAKALDVDPNAYPLWEQLIIINNQLEDYEGMVEHSEKAMALFPSQPLLYVLNAVGNLQLKNYSEALKSLESGQIYVTDNKRLEAQFELYRAEAYYNLNESSKAFSAFEKVIQIEPDNFMAMNNYAYYLSVRKEQLEKAEMLSGRVVQANPDNATYLDTHAWVLFQKKEYRLAKFYMDTALKNGGDENEVVVEHYGDILFMLNDVEGALEYWQKSLEMGNNSETLKLKIKEKRFIEEQE